MRPIIVTVGPLAAASANALALSQTPASAGALTLNGALTSGGIVTMDKPRRVLITTTGNESAKTFTITGTNWSGNPISETLTGPNISTVASVLDYSTITSITISAAAAAALTVGTNSVAGSPWVRLDPWANAQVAVQCDVTGTANYTLQQTLDNPNDPSNPITAANVIWLPTSDAAAVGATTSVQTNYAYAPTWARIVLNSGTGSVVGTFVQFGVAPY